QIRREPRRPDDSRRGGEPLRVERAELDLHVGQLAAQRVEAGRRVAAVDHEHALAETRQIPRRGEARLAEPYDEGPGLRVPPTVRTVVEHQRHHHRIFRLASPIRTRITVMIQKRTMTFGSAQPFSSKW